MEDENLFSQKSIGFFWWVVASIVLVSIHRYITYVKLFQVEQ